MVVSYVELYEALKESMAPETARLLVEALSTRDVATKADVEGLREASKADVEGLRAWAEQRFQKIDQHFQKIDERFAKIDEQLAGLREVFMKWILVFFVPLWITMFVAIVTGLLRG